MGEFTKHSCSGPDAGEGDRTEEGRGLTCGVTGATVFGISCRFEPAHNTVLNFICRHIACTESRSCDNQQGCTELRIRTPCRVTGILLKLSLTSCNHSDRDLFLLPSHCSSSQTVAFSVMVLKGTDVSSRGGAESADSKPSYAYLL
jgi:hypothetical protein